MDIAGEFSKPRNSTPYRNDHAKHGKEQEGAKVMTKMIRRKIENRVMVVMANLTERKKKPEFIAAEIVEIVLRDSA